MRILLVDDDEATLELLESLLESAGHRVALATDGDQAFQKFCELGPFDLVLSDVMHPGPDGIELARTIRERNPEQRIGILTGYPVLSKPCSREQLLEFVERLKPPI